ncbi:MAG: protein kinase [Gemmatimonadales bacterium]
MTDMLGRLTMSLAGRYTIERELGQGGMATVYLAHDVRHDRQVAVKVLLPDLAAAVGTERFLREIRTAARLSHPHILPLYDSGEAAGTLFYVMPLASGESLRERLGRDVQLPIGEALQIVREVAEALAHAHTQNIVHRDIKPENILLSGGHAVLADFGIAAVLGAAGDAKLTGTGMAIGTPTYMSPEQAAGERVDGRSDVYSLGCVLYELLAGTPPFAGPSAQAVVARHLADPVPSIRTVRATVPMVLERAVMKAMAKVPADRFTTASEFAAALPRDVHLLDAGTEALSPSNSPRPRGGRVWARATGIGLALLLVLGISARVAGLWGPGRGTGRAIKYLAVMPIQNLTGDTSQLYLAEAVTVQIATGLSQIAALRVVALKDLGTIEARDRFVRDNRIDVVLGGSLTRSGSAVRITVQLSSATTGQLLPGGRSYDGDDRHIFDLEAEVARSVADSIRVTMTPQERSRLTTERRAVNSEALDAYVRGLHFAAGVTEPDKRKGVYWFQQAIAKDSAYATAWAGLAMVYTDIGYLGMDRPDVAFPLARNAADRALTLDSSLGDAHVATGYVAFYNEWNFAVAERDILRGLALDPRSATDHWIYGMLLTAMNRPDSAIAEVRRAQVLDPASLLIHGASARSYYNAGRYSDAITQSLSTLELDSNYSRSHYWLGKSYEQTQRPADAIREFEKAVRLAPIPVNIAALGHAQAGAGDRARAEQVLRDLQERSRSSYVSSFDIATVYAGLGDKARALEWLEKSYDERAPVLVFLSVDPQFIGFKDDPHFRDLLRRIGTQTRS